MGKKTIILVKEIKEGESLLPILQQFEDQLSELGPVTIAALEKQTELAKQLGSLAVRVDKLNIAPLTTRLDELEAQVLELSTRPEEIKASALSAPKSMVETLRGELASLQEDPETAIARKMEYGLGHDAAVSAVNKRVTHLQRELGISPAVKSAAKAAGKVAAMIAMIIGLFALALPAQADQQGYPSTYGSPTNWPTVVTNGYGAPLQYIKLRQLPQMAVGYQLAFACSWTNLSGAVNCWFYPSVDGTNITTGQAPGILSGTLNSTNTVIIETNFVATQLRGYTGLFVVCSNNCSGTIPTNVVVQGTLTYSNSWGIVESNIPAGPLWNQPNQ